MAHISYNKLWELEFDNIVSTKDKMQDNNLNQLLLGVHSEYMLLIERRNGKEQFLNLLMVKIV